MRPDMGKVLTEKTRYGGGFKTPKGTRRNRDFDDLPSRESMGKDWKLALQDKEFAYVLRPIIRFLRSRVGTPWDEVYSDVRFHISQRSYLDIRLLEHLKRRVEQNVRIVDGIVYDSIGNEVFGYSGYDEFYVDEKGILRLAPTYDCHRRKFYRRVPNCPDYVCIDEIWYEVTYNNFPEYGSKTYEHQWPQYDVVCKGNVFRQEAINYYGKAVYAASKRQLNKTEIRKLRLRETV